MELLQNYFSLAFRLLDIKFNLLGYTLSFSNIIIFIAIAGLLLIIIRRLFE